MRGDKPIYLDWTGLRLGLWVVEELKCQVKVREHYSALFIFSVQRRSNILDKRKEICAICINALWNGV